jgi:hypothetical protein
VVGLEMASGSLAAVTRSYVSPMPAEELAELARCVRTGVAPETGAAEGIAALRAIRETLEGNAWQPAPR